MTCRTLQFVLLICVFNAGYEFVQASDETPVVVGFLGVGVGGGEAEEEQYNCDDEQSVEVGALHGWCVLVALDFVW